MSPRTNPTPGINPAPLPESGTTIPEVPEGANQSPKEARAALARDTETDRLMSEWEVTEDSGWDNLGFAKESVQTRAEQLKKEIEATRIGHITRLKGLVSKRTRAENKAQQEKHQSLLEQHKRELAAIDKYRQDEQYLFFKNVDEIYNEQREAESEAAQQDTEARGTKYTEVFTPSEEASSLALQLEERATWLQEQITSAGTNTEAVDTIQKEFAEVQADIATNEYLKSRLAELRENKKQQEEELQILTTDLSSEQPEETQYKEALSKVAETKNAVDNAQQAVTKNSDGIELLTHRLSAVKLDDEMRAKTQAQLEALSVEQESRTKALEDAEDAFTKAVHDQVQATKLVAKVNELRKKQRGTTPIDAEAINLAIVKIEDVQKQVDDHLAELQQDNKNIAASQANIDRLLAVDDKSSVLTELTQAQENHKKLIKARNKKGVEGAPIQGELAALNAQINSTEAKAYLELVDDLNTTDQNLTDLRAETERSTQEIADREEARTTQHTDRQTMNAAKERILGEDGSGNVRALNSQERKAASEVGNEERERGIADVLYAASQLPGAGESSRRDLRHKINDMIAKGELKPWLEKDLNTVVEQIAFGGRGLVKKFESIEHRREAHVKKHGSTLEDAQAELRVALDQVDSKPHEEGDDMAVFNAMDKDVLEEKIEALDELEEAWRNNSNSQNAIEVLAMFKKQRAELDTLLRAEQEANGAEAERILDMYNKQMFDYNLDLFQEQDTAKEDFEKRNTLREQLNGLADTLKALEEEYYDTTGTYPSPRAPGHISLLVIPPWEQEVHTAETVKTTAVAPREEPTEQNTQQSPEESYGLPRVAFDGATTQTGTNLENALAALKPEEVQDFENRREYKNVFKQIENLLNAREPGQLDLMIAQASNDVVQYRERITDMETQGPPTHPQAKINAYNRKLAQYNTALAEAEVRYILGARAEVLNDAKLAHEAKEAQKPKPTPAERMDALIDKSRKLEDGVLPETQAPPQQKTVPSMPAVEIKQDAQILAEAQTEQNLPPVEEVLSEFPDEDATATIEMEATEESPQDKDAKDKEKAQQAEKEKAERLAAEKKKSDRGALISSSTKNSFLLYIKMAEQYLKDYGVAREDIPGIKEFEKNILRETKSLAQSDSYIKYLEGAKNLIRMFPEHRSQLSTDSASRDALVANIEDWFTQTNASEREYKKARKLLEALFPGQGIVLEKGSNEPAVVTEAHNHNESANDTTEEQKEFEVPKLFPDLFSTVIELRSIINPTKDEQRHLDLLATALKNRTKPGNIDKEIEKTQAMRQTGDVKKVLQVLLEHKKAHQA